MVGNQTPAKRDAAFLIAWQEKFGSMGVVQGAREMSDRIHRLRGLGAPREGRILQPGDAALLDAILTGLPIPGPRRLRDIVARELNKVQRSLQGSEIRRDDFPVSTSL